MKMFAWQRKTAEQIQRAIELYQSGLSWQSIAEQMGGSSDGWKQAAERIGFKSRTKSESRRMMWRMRGSRRPADPVAARLYDKFRNCGMSPEEAAAQAQVLRW